MADFQLRVTAETQKAEKDLQRLDKTANEATKGRKLNIDISELNKNFKNVEKNVKEAGNTIQTFYRVSKNIPGIGDRVKEFENLAKGTADLAKNAPASAAALRENAKAGSILSSSLETAGGAAGRLINGLAKAGFALFAVKEAVGVLKGAFGGFFNETIGREIKLRETILKTQTTLASTNKVFRNGAEITDPYEKIVALTGEVAKRIDSIRERSIALAGVTSNDVIEVFGIVASQVGQIGGGLKEAEDLAISFSAALGTFGLPLEQARQEIGSILRGDVGPDSYLAAALGIGNKDIQEAKSKIGGVLGFLKEKLAASVAGQAIAAQGFAGVVSNIQDLGELISQKFGAGLLDPMLGGLTRVFDFLFKIREEVFAISEGIGRGLGQLLSTNLTAVGGGSALFGELGAGAEGFAASLAEGVKRAFASLQSDANAFIAPVRNLLEELTKSIVLVAEGLAQLAQGFISIKIENLKALVQIFSNLSEAVTVFTAGLGQVLRTYGQILQVPFVQYLSQISAQFQLLEKLGVLSAVKLGIAAVGLIAAWQPIVTFFQTLVARIAALLGGLVIAVGAAITRIGAVIASFAATLAATTPAAEAFKQQLLGLASSLTAAGAAADKAGISVTRLGGATAAAARTASTALLSFVKFNLILLGIQLAITVLVDLFGRYQRAQEEASRQQRAEQALTALSTKYRNVGESADAATKSARDFNKALVDAEYARSVERLEEIRKELNDLRFEAQLGIQTWGEFFRLFDVRRTLQRALGNSPDAIDASKLIAEEKKLRDFQKKVEKEQDKKNIEDKITLEADKRINLEKEIAEFRKQQEDALFQQRQTLAQKEVEIFRAAGELRIFQMEQANAKLLEGEEGASAAALESLNNYLATRERGELDIEAAKRSLAVEVTNLERQIVDYRLDLEKKIFELRKRAGENDIKSAQLRRQQLEAAAGIVPGGTVRGGAVVTGRNDPDGEQTGSDIALKGGVGAAIQNPFSSLRITKVGQQGSGSGVSGRGFGNYVTAETVLNGKKFEILLGHLDETVVRVGDVLEAGAVIGTQGITGRATGPHVSTHVNALNGGNANSVLGAIENAWVKGGTIQSRSMAQAPVVEPLQSISDIPDTSEVADRYAAAVRGVASALERARALQEALTSAKTAAAFDAIAKAAFPKVALEEYDNQAIELTSTLDALRGISADLYDPEQIRIAVEQKSKELIADRERNQILDEAEKRLKANQITQAEFDKLTADLAERQKKYNADLAKETEARRRNLELTKQQNAVESLKRATGAIRFDVARAGVQGQAAMAQAFAGDDSLALRRIEAEQKIADKRIELEEQFGKGSADVTRELTAFAEKTRAAATELGRIDEAVKAFAAQMAMIRDVSKTLVDGYKGLAQSFLSGGDLKEAVNQMSKAITDKVVGIVLDSAFKPIEDFFVQTLKDVFRIEDPTLDLQEANNAALGANTVALEGVTAALSTQSAGPIALPSIPNGGITATDLQAVLDNPAFGQQAVEATLEQSFKGIGESLTNLGSVAENAGAQTDSAAETGKQGFGKFFSAMTGVATGALAIVGAIDALQESKGGTYGTLMGIAGILGGLGAITGSFASLGKKATGGPVTARRPYMVGEVGPELFVPGTSGTIIPNNRLTENRMYLEQMNRGASSSPLEMGTDADGGMAAATRAAIKESNRLQETRSQIFSQQQAIERRYERERIESMSAAPGRLNIKYESQVINNVEYVTKDQAERMSAQSALRGRELALSALQNSVKTRKRVGML